MENNNQLPCKVIMLPIKHGDAIDTPLGIQGNDLLKYTGGHGMKGLGIGTPQHLYLTSDIKIEQNDWVMVENGKTPIVGKVKCVFPTVLEVDLRWSTTQTKTITDCKLILASTDKSLTLADIPDSFIREYVKSIDAGGKIKEVNLEMQYDINTINVPEDGGNLYDESYKLKINRRDNTVIIIEK